MELLRKLSNINNNDTALVGGKGASLGEMKQMGIPLASGFVILTTAFEKFLQETDLNDVIDSILQSTYGKGMSAIEIASEKIIKLILGAEIPKNIATVIQKYYKDLGAKNVAVRSSATAEDSGDAAWAGLLESHLNTTEKNLLENVKDCWASLFSPRAIFYRFEKKLHRQKISVAVVVQKMIESEKSGVAFSVHPTTHNENQILIEAGRGLGEAIVSGHITPDAYTVKKIPRQIEDKSIQTSEQVLSDSEISALTKLILNIEKHFGFPVDIEWAEERGKFIITQCRPITTLYSKTKDKQNTLEYIKSQNWFFGVRADESLLFFSAKRNGYTKYIKREYGVEFAESLLITLKKDHPIRVFNLWQAKDFHAISSGKILEDPNILASYVDENDALYQDMENYGVELIMAIDKDDYHTSVKVYNKIRCLYEIASGQFIIIFSLGLKLTENKDNLQNIEGIIKKHDRWRNTVAFKEEAIGEKLFYFFRYLIRRKKLKIKPLSIMKLLTLNEVEQWLGDKLKDAEIENIIKSRKIQGFIYQNLRNVKREVIDDPVEIKEIQEYFLALDKESIKSRKNNDLRGNVAYSSSEIMKGEVLVVKDKSELPKKSSLIIGKILVATQTTPHYIPYIKNAKAIITDEGGLTCHAAILARELGIPCIVGTKMATQILKDKDYVEVDFGKGTIIIDK